MPEWTVIRKGRLVPIPQEDDATCWRAAYQMMFDWKGKQRDVIDTTIRGGVANAELCYKLGLDKSDWERVGKLLGMKTAKATKPFTASQLAGYMANGPVLIHGKFAQGIHSIVVTGVSVATGFFESGDEEMTSYINPYWTGTKEVRERTSAFNKYVKDGVERQDGQTGVIQYWAK